MTRNAYRMDRPARCILSCCAGLAASCIASAQTAPPSELEPADAHHVVASLAASGVQIYVCKPDQSHHLVWTFKSPQADLYDGSGKLVAKHYAGPSWEATDGSKITGKVLQQMPNAQQPGSIPLLLLKATSAGAPGELASVRYVQRWNTRGGAAPLQPCTQEGQEGRSPYLADYVFLD
ncbi:hypothetical protein R52603_00144 [Paraburkholderia saeva]|jgi:hypothetical protein|uniref:DUF3455 domain-containing protein n=2 Tax=Paraburkholderia saeva TaxID=2777537 RepID=A0A9N8X0G3_9BURK|nr:DUF3455 domain-containing protein [Paraburkholderia saeva]CAG4886234.1 hypothetical protein R52603_00144 [Paraburkholderia saeva]CAG4893751.1 hypothetical protein LMG31841_01763 [Paraburkholderia saeva]CAG4907908.1 hypothetical protein R70241_03566 [Paraburkholderia saeva]